MTFLAFGIFFAVFGWCMDGECRNPRVPHTPQKNGMDSFFDFLRG